MSFGAWLKAHYEDKGPAKWPVFLLELASSVVLFLLMLITCVDVVGRYLFASPLPGATELTEIGLAVMVFAAIPVITWCGGHIVVDLLDRVLGQSVVKGLNVLAALVISASLYFVGDRIYDMGARSLSRGTITEYLAIPTGYLVQYIAVMSWITAAGMLTYGLYRTLFMRAQ